MADGYALVPGEGVPNPKELISYPGWERDCKNH